MRSVLTLFLFCQAEPMEEDEAGPVPSTSGYSSSRLRGRTEVGADEVGIRPRATAGTSRDANSGPEKGKWHSRNLLLLP